MLSIDRIEKEEAICVDDRNNNIIKINCKKIIGKAKEGCVLKIENGKFVVDETETKKRRAEVFKLQSSIFDD